MQHSPTAKPVVVGITGASGSMLAAAVIDRLLAIDVPVVATASSAARMVWREEMEESFGAALERWDSAGAFTFHPVGELRAPIASGTFPALGMIIVPCSMATVAAVARTAWRTTSCAVPPMCASRSAAPSSSYPASPPKRHPPPQPHRARPARRNHIAAGARLLPAPAHHRRRGPSSWPSAPLAALGVTDALPPNMRYEGPRT